MLFLRRSNGYKAGLALLVVASITYAVGISSPNWTSYKIILSIGDGSMENPYFEETFHGYNGLWVTCDYVIGFMSKSCESVTSLNGEHAWINAVQAFQCLGIIGLLLACGYAFVVNFVLSSPDTNNQRLEMLTIASGILGFIGDLVYVSESSGTDDILVPQTGISGDILRHLLHDDNTTTRSDFDWAFYISVTGSILTLASGVVLCAQNRLIPRQEVPSVGVTFSRDHSQI